MFKTPREAVDELIERSGILEANWRASVLLKLPLTQINNSAGYTIDDLQADLVSRFAAVPSLLAACLGVEQLDLGTRTLLIRTAPPSSLLVAALLVPKLDLPSIALASTIFGDRWPGIASELMSHDSDDPAYNGIIKSLQETALFTRLPVIIVALPAPRLERTSFENCTDRVKPFEHRQAVRS